MNKNVFRKPRAETKFTWAMPRQEKGRMKSNDLIKQCRYYKGEEECPYKDGSQQAFWGYEEAWVEMMLEQNPYLQQCTVKYAENGLGGFAKEDNTPLSLKAILFNRYEYWCEGSTEGFKKFYKKEYIGA